jgi:S1-C subfamily serine protease
MDASAGRSSGAGWGAPAVRLGSSRALDEARLHGGRWMGNCGAWRRYWILWPIVLVVVISSAAGALRGPFRLRGLSGAAGKSSTKRPPASFLNVDDFRDDGGGALVDSSYPPDSPLDKAGLVGGDVITAFDAHPVTGTSDLKKILAATPAGKTVDVVFLRDGQTKTAALTTVTEGEIEKLDDKADDREDETKGFIGAGDDLERVLVPGTSIYGVRLNDVDQESAAESAGLRNGDVVIEFNGTPMRTRKELESRIERAVPGSTVKAVVMREGQRIETSVQIGHED